MTAHTAAGAWPPCPVRRASPRAPPPLSRRAGRRPGPGSGRLRGVQRERWGQRPSAARATPYPADRDLGQRRAARHQRVPRRYGDQRPHRASGSVKLVGLLHRHHRRLLDRHHEHRLIGRLGRLLDRHHEHRLIGRLDRVERVGRLDRVGRLERLRVGRFERGQLGGRQLRRLERLRWVGLRRFELRGGRFPTVLPAEPRRLLSGPRPGESRAFWGAADAQRRRDR